MSFFFSWSLWEQMSFCLGAALALTVCVGIGRNMYTWRRNRRYVRLYGLGGTSTGDLEARVIDADEIPFGIKALQRGVEVEGVWISRANTPMPSPSLSAFPSPASSIIGSGSSISLSKSHPPNIKLPDSIIPFNRADSPRLPSFGADSFRSLSLTRESFDFSFDFQFEEGAPSGVNSSTLEALEGRGRSSRRSHERLTRYRSRSELHFSRVGDGFSMREDSPSPPALTDGTSRADTPVSSSAEAKSTLTVLSESNHRLSHVAETGQLTPRTRPVKHGDSVTIPSISSLDSASHRQTYNFSTPLPRVRAVSGHLSAHSVSSTKSNSFHLHTDPGLDQIHAPRPLLTVDFDKMARRSTSDPESSLPNLRSPSSALLYPGQNLSPILAEYLGEPNLPQIRRVSAHHTVRSSRVITESSIIPPPQPAAQGYLGEYRKVNPSFEVKRGTMGSLAVPLDLPPLELPSLESKDKDGRKDKRKSKRLQKKRQSDRRSKSVGADPSRAT